MNIHFDDETLFFQLMDSALAVIPIGSTEYGTDNDDSDNDYIVIYAEALDNVDSYIWSHHQLQYTGKEGCDYMFTSLTQFIQNLLKGDQTILYEAVTSDAMKGGTSLTWLSNRANSHHTFDNYSVIKAYLGFAKRDVKQARQMLSNLKDVTHPKFRKKISHAYRSCKMGERVKQLAYVGNPTVGTGLKSIYEETSRLKEGKSVVFKNLYKESEEGVMLVDNSHVLRFLDDLDHKIKVLRLEANKLFEQKEIPRYATIHNLQVLDVEMKNFMASDAYKFKQRRHIDYGDIWYKALEDDVQYSKGK